MSIKLTIHHNLYFLDNLTKQIDFIFRFSFIVFSLNNNNSTI